MLGDGRLRPGAEMTLDAFYRAAVTSFAAATAEIEEFWNPGFNRDRGPVTVFGLRFHAEF